MKKKGTIGIVATLGLGLCAYALSQQPQVKEEKKNQIQYLQAEKKSSATASSKKEDSIEAVNAKEKTQAEQIVIKITDIHCNKDGLSSSWATSWKMSRASQVTQQRAI